MAKISDIIEEFILKVLGDNDKVDISRNELASFFSCAPSQINYVLDTRFTADRGFLRQSVRGGGGCIRLLRVPMENEQDAVQVILASVGKELSFKRSQHMMENLKREKILSKRETLLLENAFSDLALAMPLPLRDVVRANVFKSVLLFLLRDEKGKNEESINTNDYFDTRNKNSFDDEGDIQ